MNRQKISTTLVLKFCLTIVECLIMPIDLQGTSVKEVANHVNSLEYIVSNQTAVMSQMMTQIQALTSTVETLSAKVDTLSQVKETVVSFSVNLAGDKRIPVQGTVKFNHVTSNIGGGYNETTGIFHAPISGIYIFVLTVQSHGGGASDYSINKQGVTQAITSITKMFDHRTTTAVFHLNAGDDVSVEKTYDSGTNAPLRSGLWNSLSGHLLHVD